MEENPIGQDPRHHPEELTMKDKSKSEAGKLVRSELAYNPEKRGKKGSRPSNMTLGQQSKSVYG